MNTWSKVFKNGPSKIMEDKTFKNFEKKRYVLLYHFQISKITSINK